LDLLNVRACNSHNSANDPDGELRSKVFLEVKCPPILSRDPFGLVKKHRHCGLYQLGLVEHRATRKELHEGLAKTLVIGAIGSHH
jgi:hypothetical protein